MSFLSGDGSPVNDTTATRQQTTTKRGYDQKDATQELLLTTFYERAKGNNMRVLSRIQINEIWCPTHVPCVSSVNRKLPFPLVNASFQTHASR